MERLQKFLSRAGVASRRHAEALIVDRRVKVNGVIVDELGSRVDPSKDLVLVDGKLVSLNPERRYFLFYKPPGVVTTMSDPQGRPTIADYIAEAGGRVFPVGRLDYDAEGALLLTDDGELANKLMHPSHQVPRVYLAKVKGVPEEASLQKLVAGVRLEDGLAHAVEAVIFFKADRNTWVKIVVTEGRQHLVKRLCAAIGHPVVRLYRPAHAGLPVQGLRPGELRALTTEEVRRVKAAADGQAQPEVTLTLPARRHGHAAPGFEPIRDDDDGARPAPPKGGSARGAGTPARRQAEPKEQAAARGALEAPPLEPSDTDTEAPATAEPRSGKRSRFDAPLPADESVEAAGEENEDEEATERPSGPPRAPRKEGARSRFDARPGAAPRGRPEARASDGGKRGAAGGPFGATKGPPRREGAGPRSEAPRGAFGAGGGRFGGAKGGPRREGAGRRFDAGSGDAPRGRFGGGGRSEEGGRFGGAKGGPRREGAGRRFDGGSGDAPRGRFGGGGRSEEGGRFGGAKGGPRREGAGRRFDAGSGDAPRGRFGGGGRGEEGGRFGGPKGGPRREGAGRRFDAPSGDAPRGRFGASKGRPRPDRAGGRLGEPSSDAPRGRSGGGDRFGEAKGGPRSEVPGGRFGAAASAERRSRFSGPKREGRSFSDGPRRSEGGRSGPGARKGPGDRGGAGRAGGGPRRGAGGGRSGPPRRGGGKPPRGKSR